MSQRHVVAKVGEIAVGTRKMVSVEGREIGVFNVNGDYYALLNRCPHEGGALCDGRIFALIESDEPGTYKVSRHGEMLRCPWHGWEFDIRTGQSWCDPSRVRVRSYPVKVEAGGALVEGPYVAETYKVTVDESYIVVEL